MLDIKEFSNRLSRLRTNKGVSAREMSLSIGQGVSYINNLESGLSYPSMSAFFYICEYLGITPDEFFKTDVRNPVKLKELEEAAKGLRDEDMNHLIAIAKGLKR